MLEVHYPLFYFDLFQAIVNFLEYHKLLYAYNQ